jgi:hypothetical protein
MQWERGGEATRRWFGEGKRLRQHFRSFQCAGAGAEPMVAVCLVGGGGWLSAQGRRGGQLGQMAEWACFLAGLAGQGEKGAMGGLHSWTGPKFQKE